MTSNKHPIIELDIFDIGWYGSIPAAIEKWSERYYGFMAGVVPPTDPSSSVDDHARCAFERYNARVYIDSSSGRVMGRWDLKWSDHSMVRLLMPLMGDILKFPEAFAEMLRAIPRHSYKTDRLGWADILQDWQRVSAAIAGIDIQEIKGCIPRQSR